MDVAPGPGSEEGSDALPPSQNTEEVFTFAMAAAVRPIPIANLDTALQPVIRVSGRAKAADILIFYLR